MSSPMSKPARGAAAPSSPTATISPPGPLAGLMKGWGYSAQIVVARIDGKPMSAKDQEQAAWLVEESEQRDATDDEIGDAGQAYLDKQATKPASRTKRAVAPAAGKAARTAKR